MPFGVTPIDPTIPRTPPEFSQFIQFESEGLPLSGPDVQIVNILSPLKATRGVGEHAHIITIVAPPVTAVSLTGVGAAADVGDMGVAPVFGPAQFFSFIVPNSAAGVLAFSNGNLTASYGNGSGVWSQARISDAFNNQVYSITDKRYFEIEITGGPSNYFGVAVGFIDNNITDNTQVSPFSIPSYMASSCDTTVPTTILPGVFVNGSLINDPNFSAHDGAIIGVAIDGTTGRCYFSTDGTWVDGADPVAGTNAAFVLPSAAFTAWITTHDNNTRAGMVFNAFLGVTNFTPPAGYKPWALQ